MGRPTNPRIAETMERYGVSRRTACRMLANETTGPTDPDGDLAGKGQHSPEITGAPSGVENELPPPEPSGIENDPTGDGLPQPIEANQIERRACHGCRHFRSDGWTVCRDGWRQRPARSWCPHFKAPTNDIEATREPSRNTA